MNERLPSWGAEAVGLNLPGTLVTIEGLSSGQRQDIARDYATFLIDPSGLSVPPGVRCRAVRLAEPVGLPLEHFSENNQYTPRIQRTGRGIEIAGYDFVVDLERGSSFPLRALLAVANEEELADARILENFLRILVAHYALDQGGVLLHSVGLLHEGRAYLFCGRSNAGKTTLARKAEAAGARILSDDINLVIPEQGAFRAHRVPFTGEFGRRVENRSGAGSYALGGLALLEKAPVLSAAPVSSAEAVARLLTGCPFVNNDPKEFPALMNILTRLVVRTPIIRLGVARDDSFEAVMATLLRQYEHG